MDFYNNGGGAGLGLHVPNQTLPAGKLNLNDREKKALVAFMETLTDAPAAEKPATEGAVVPVKMAVQHP